MNKTQKGFAVLEGLLILVIIAIIGGTGYFVWHSKAQTDKNLDNASNTSTSVATTKNTIKPTDNTAKTDTELIAAAIANKCQSTIASVNKTQLQTTLTNQYNSKDSSLKISGNFATAGATCDPSTTNGDESGGFAVWLKKQNTDWTVVFQGQQSPDCAIVDGHGWPSIIIDQCYDSQTQAERSVK